LQHTLLHPVRFQGFGLHSGKPARLVLHPAPAGHGIVFRRVDECDLNQLVPARWDMAERSPLHTKLVNDDGVSVATVEHLMAALAGTGVQNVLIDIDGPEIPILDGSAVQFVRGIVDTGLRDQRSVQQVLRILRPVTVTGADGATARLVPADNVEMRFEIDFPDSAIGRQTRDLNLQNGRFARELCDSRTFCRLSDVDAMRAAGLALGGTFDNAVVVDGDQVLSPGGFRHTDEAVRHKMLDALGDLALAGAPIIGRYEGYKAGHSLTNTLLRALFDTPDAFEWVDLTPQLAARMPGAGLVWDEIPRVA
jgi:UDP-3-O-[3-hydroxymyristoyl] N-acetylglucosamine deacetylase